MKIDSLKINDIWQEKIESKKDAWINYLKNQYVEYAETYIPSIENDLHIPVKDLEMEMINNLRNILDSLLDTLKLSGVNSILTASFGAGLIVAAPFIPFVGTVASIAGVAVIGFSVIPLIPAITKSIREKNERDKTRRENEVRRNLEQIDVSPLVEKILSNAHAGIYSYVVGKLNNDLKEPKKSYDACKEIVGSITEDLKSLDLIFPKKMSSR